MRGFEMLDGDAEAPKSRSVTLDLVKGFAIIVWLYSILHFSKVIQANLLVNPLSASRCSKGYPTP